MWSLGFVAVLLITQAGCQKANRPVDLLPPIEEINVAKVDQTADPRTVTLAEVEAIEPGMTLEAFEERFNGRAWAGSFHAFLSLCDGGGAFCFLFTDPGRKAQMVCAIHFPADRPDSDPKHPFRSMSFSEGKYVWPKDRKNESFKFRQQ